MDRYKVVLSYDVQIFLQRLPEKLRAKASRSVDLLKEFGPYLSMPHVRALKGVDGLRELRVKLASDIVRLFFFQYRGEMFIITSGFVKKSDRTDRRELERAIRLMKSFKEQNP